MFQGFKQKVIETKEKVKGKLFASTKVDEIIDELTSHEVRFVLLGKTGAGKSATGCTILGTDNAFKTSGRPKSCTLICQHSEADRFGKRVRVVDTPGLMDTDKDEETIRKELIKCTANCAPGPHAFLLVLRADVRFTEEERKTLHRIKSYFGGDIYQYMIILFTRKEQMDYTLMELVEDMPRAFQEVYTKCNKRVMAIGNKDTKGKRELQARELLEMVYGMVKDNGENYFSDKAFKVAEKVLRQNAEKLKKEVEEEFKEKEEEFRKKEIELEHKNNTLQEELQKMKTDIEQMKLASDLERKREEEKAQENFEKMKAEKEALEKKQMEEKKEKEESERIKAAKEAQLLKQRLEEMQKQQIEDEERRERQRKEIERKIEEERMRMEAKLRMEQEVREREREERNRIEEEKRRRFEEKVLRDREETRRKAEDDESGGWISFAKNVATTVGGGVASAVASGVGKLFSSWF